MRLAAVLALLGLAGCMAPQDRGVPELVREVVPAGTPRSDIVQDIAGCWFLRTPDGLTPILNPPGIGICTETGTEMAG